jgi:hypothetical protein
MAVMPDICNTDTTRVLLPQLVRDWSDYPRARMLRSWVEDLTAMIRDGVRWSTPLVADEDLHLLDGWHRVAAYEAVYGADAARLEVEVAVLPVPPGERLLTAARLNREHGARLSDEDAAMVAVRLAEVSAGEDVRKALRRYARLLVVDYAFAKKMLRPASVDRRIVKAVPRPPMPFDRAGMTASAIEEAARWLDEALGWQAREALQDSAVRSALERLRARLDYLLRANTGGGV